MDISVRELVVVGDGMCGKSSAIHVYLGNQFPSRYISTVYDSHTCKFNFQGKDILLRLWDTAVQEDFEVFRPLLYRQASAFIVMYSVDRPESLANVYEKWIPEVRQYCPNAPIVLVANKADLRYNPSTLAQLSENDVKPVSTSEGWEVAKKIRAVAFRECSALTGNGVREAFKAALQATQRKEQNMEMVHG